MVLMIMLSSIIPFLENLHSTVCVNEGKLSHITKLEIKYVRDI